MVASKKSPTHVNNNVLRLLTFTDRQLSNPCQTNEEKNANKKYATKANEYIAKLVFERVSITLDGLT
jgi:hypothetical protein